MFFSYALELIISFCGKLRPFFNSPTETGPHLHPAFPETTLVEMLDLQEQYVCDDIQKAVISQSGFHFLVENLFTGGY